MTLSRRRTVFVVYNDENRRISGPDGGTHLASHT
jgi:hypothetical protein